MCCYLERQDTQTSGGHCFTTPGRGWPTRCVADEHDTMQCIDLILLCVAGNSLLPRYRRCTQRSRCHRCRMWVPPAAFSAVDMCTSEALVAHDILRDRGPGSPVCPPQRCPCRRLRYEPIRLFLIPGLASVPREDASLGNLVTQAQASFELRQPYLFSQNVATSCQTWQASR